MQLHRAREDFEAAGVGLVLIGQASPRQAAHFRRTLRVDLPILADEDRATYRLAGAKVATMGELIGPRSVLKGLQASRRSGVHQGRTIGDPAQLGGTLLIGTDGAVAWSHLSEDASDNAPPTQILAAASALSG